MSEPTGSSDDVLARADFEASDLVKRFPPRLHHASKKLVHALACPPGAEHRGQISFSRWREMPLPDTLEDHPTELVSREDVFGYEPEPEGTVAWYVNFANFDLFSAYGGRLLAQDELQVAEHPALGSLREALLASRTSVLTVEKLRPTPILVTGVERRCSLATAKIYGHRFAVADEETIRRATRALTPPTVTNLLAIEAPSHGHGIYKRKEIELILATAYTGFAAAQLESARLAPSPTSSPVVAVHTGFWGCGAYGGNRVLMAALQVLAARLAGLDRLVFHTFDRSGTSALEEARRVVEPIAVAGANVAEIVKAVDALELAWGVSDGT